MYVCSWPLDTHQSTQFSATAFIWSECANNDHVSLGVCVWCKLHDKFSNVEHTNIQKMKKWELNECANVSANALHTNIGEEIVHISVEMNSSQNGAQLNNDQTIGGQRISIWCITFVALPTSNNSRRSSCRSQQIAAYNSVLFWPSKNTLNHNISNFGVQVIFQIFFSSSLHMVYVCFSFFLVDCAVRLDVTYFVFSFILIVVHLRLSFSHLKNFNCFLFILSFFIHLFGCDPSIWNRMINENDGRKESGTALARQHHTELSSCVFVIARESVCVIVVPIYIFICTIARACFGAHSKSRQHW